MSKTKNTWEMFAQENAEFYIKSASDVDFATTSGQDLFKQLGREDTRRILRESAPFLRGFTRAIEIGCGIGRLAAPMSEHFIDVIGVDIAPTMIRRLNDFCHNADITNVRGFLAEEPWDEQGPADFIYSHIVFQHVADGAVIANYFARIANCLSDDGICYAQFDTRPRTLPYFLRMVLPDSVLPRTSRRGIRRVRRRPTKLRAMFESCDLTVLQEIRECSDDHVFLVRRSNTTA